MDTQHRSGSGSAPALPPLAKMVFVLACAKLLIHCATNFRYGFFRDELYYIQWADHLAWGYVEQPPFTAFAVYFSRLVLGDSLFALRFLPALCGAVVVFLTGLMAREMGGRRFAQSFAALCVLVGPTFLGIHALMTMNSFDQLFWVVCLLLLIRLVRTGNPRLWYLFGLFAGLGLMNKLSMLFFGAGLVAALLLSSERRYFLRKELWLGGAIAIFVFTPFLVWLATHDWVTLEFMFNYGGGGKTTQASFLHWLYMQVVTVHPLTLPVWLAGLYYCFRDSQGKRFRVIAWLFVVLYAMFFALKAKFYFLSPAFPMLLAAGAVVFEGVSARHEWKRIRVAYVALLVSSGALLAPQTIPVLPTEALVKYARVLGGNAGVTSEQMAEDELPQHFADQFGWEAMVSTAAEVFHGLSPEEQAECAILASNYGEAAAIDFYGPSSGLPRAISGHNSYYLWGPGDTTGDVIIAIFSPDSEDMLKEIFKEVTIAARNDCHLCMPYERRRVFFLCRGMKAPISKTWPLTRQFG